MKYMAQHDHGGRPQTLNFATESVNLVFHNSLASSLTLVHLTQNKVEKSVLFTYFVYLQRANRECNVAQGKLLYCKY